MVPQLDNPLVQNIVFTQQVTNSLQSKNLGTQPAPAIPDVQITFFWAEGDE
jgi:hypothetical protein